MSLDKQLVDGVYDFATQIVELERKLGTKDTEFRTLIEIDGKFTSIVIETQRVSEEKAEKIDKGLEELKIVRQKEDPFKTVDVLDIDDDGNLKFKEPTTTANKIIQTIKESREDFDNTADAIMEMISKTFKDSTPPITIVWYAEALRLIVKNNIYPRTPMSETLFLEIHTEMCKKASEMFGGLVATAQDMEKMNDIKKDLEKGV